MSGCRIGRVKLKGGADLRIIHADVSTHRREIAADINWTMDNMEGHTVHGYVFVVWGENGSVGSNCFVYDGVVAEAMVPDYVRSILIQHRASRALREHGQG